VDGENLCRVQGMRDGDADRRECGEFLCEDVLAAVEAARDDNAEARAVCERSKDQFQYAHRHEAG